MKEKTFRFLKASSRSSLCTAIVIVGMAAISLITGDAGYGTASIHRESDPFFYWAIITIELAAATAFFSLSHKDNSLAKEGESEIAKIKDEEYKRKLENYKARRAKNKLVASGKGLQ